MRFFSDGVTAHRKGDGYAKWNDDEKTKKNACPHFTLCRTFAGAPVRAGASIWTA